ncbi:threonine--tRNA ligase [Permianibacter aggregans]|uniref:Threonine--tRNA ligase n=1 Tax=Permianibacter aggregans TaxID=1510150 RepID=A0A4R6UTT1_9GAMM|nr:threonine--tRNA ligase [Permianibacter aggregans]QGX38759.1 threonine--tRNA ligase [Permianibacter aggregans]TDQ50562.1 threonyl-tRNA synthetase [Permianibacter aggregans]
MPVVRLPDGSERRFDGPVTVMQVAESIGPGLAKAALAGKVNGKEVDTSYTITDDVELAIITEKSEEGLEVIRHSTAHLLAQAVKQLYPDVQVTIGPVIEDGFYYDFAAPKPFTPEDLEKIEKRMAELAAKDIPVHRRVMPRDEAVEHFKQMGEHFKAEIIASIPGDEDISLYGQGDFEDLCRGPHVPSTGKLKAFKLMRVSGAYWRGDTKNQQLQRVYGTAWANKKDLEAYLHRLEEAEKRDHRKIGKALDLFHVQEEGPGMVFWHNNGWTIWQEIESYIRKRLRQEGYQEVRTPQVIDLSLWERSGHWGKYSPNMFTTESENRTYAIKPMNCPCHVQIYNAGLHSYRDLPLRMAEFGSCHRNEPSGALHGLMRVRGFTQDDAHIFCTEDQIADEVVKFIDLLYSVYQDFGFKDVIVKLSTRPEQRIGTDAMWDKAEQALADALNQAGLPFEYLPGEGAFYGPKIEFTLKDSIGRMWQCGTMQVDYNMPERLGAEYVDENSARRTPVMLHRAILGSLERFIGILIENYAGWMPTWLAPQQVSVLSITERTGEFCEKVAQGLNEQGFRAASDLRNEKISYKIREHTLQRVPYLLVVGDREVDANSVAVRRRDGKDLGVMSVEAFTDLLAKDVASRGRAILED